MEFIRYGIVLVTFLVGRYFITVRGSISIECYPNTTIKMANPRPDFFTNGVANDSVQICAVTFTSNKSDIFISGCNMDETILLSLTKRTTNDVVIGGFGSQLYFIRCVGVGDGVNKSIAHTFLPRVNNPMDSRFAVTAAPMPLLGHLKSPSSVPYTSVSPRTMLSYAESVFREGNTSGQELTSALVGSKIVWSMECAAQYYLSILNCTAYGGLSTSSTDSVVLVVEGCSQDTSLVSTNFRTANHDIVDGEKRYYADFNVFKFINYDHLTISCSVKICPEEDNVCDMLTCPSKRRKREDAQKYYPGTYVEQNTQATLRILDVLSVGNKVESTYYIAFSLVLLYCLLLLN